MLVSEREVDELRSEVEVTLAVVVPEVTPFPARDGNRVDGVLDRPGMEDVLLRVRDDLLPELAVLLDDRHDSILPRGR